MLEKLPKVELHVHLDGSIRIETAKEILNESEESVYENMIANEKCSDLNEYLTKFEYPSRILQTSNNLERIAYELATDLKRENVIYAEIRFAPLKHVNENLELNEVIDSVLNGLRKVDIKTNLILCMMRNDSYDDNIKVINLAKSYLNKGVCGIDLAGAEAIYKTEKFEKLFQLAKNMNIPFTIHSGEADGYDSINAAISFGATRLGHGIRVIEYDDLIDKIKKNNILLEICPTSNVQTNVVDKYCNHPIKKLIDKGIEICINTDNRTVSNITLSIEYKKLCNEFNFDKEQFIKTNLSAINHAFITEEEKKELIEMYLNLL